MSELNGFLARLATETEHYTRLVFADWLDERFPATPVDVGEIPKGLNAWWHTLDLVAIGMIRYSGSHGRWSNSQIGSTLANAFDQRFDHWGATVIGRRPVLVSEPYMNEVDALAHAAQIQAALGVPVSYSRRADWHERCVRIGIWFDFAAGAVG